MVSVFCLTDGIFYEAASNSTLLCTASGVKGIVDFRLPFKCSRAPLDAPIELMSAFGSPLEAWIPKADWLFLMILYIGLSGCSGPSYV